MSEIFRNAEVPQLLPRSALNGAAMPNNVFEVGRRSGRAPGDQYMDSIAASTALAEVKDHPLDGEAARKLHRQLMEWYFQERDKQSANRMEMETDAGFYDNKQWDEEDAQLVRERGQVPLVYNEIAPMIDWLIGTERRTRVDWRVLPRAEDDTKSADVKTKVLKYVSDMNRVPFKRSAAFSDSAKVGVGWIEDGARDDPTEDILYSRHEDWRCILWDSASRELDLSDARYLFRWRWVDEDIAVMMFPERADQIRRACNGDPADESSMDDWYLGNPIAGSGTLAGVQTDFTGTQRRRVRLIECQYRMPVKSQVVANGPMKGAYLNPQDARLMEVVQAHGSSIVDRITMRVHFAVMTETAMLTMAPSGYRHNRFTLTPIWFYRDNKTRLPYGAIRRVRDINQDLNKRASKALFLLNTNQVIADDGAVEDVNLAREEVDRPDGWITKKAGKSFEIRRDSEAANGQQEIMQMQAGRIQNSVGINNENLGRQSNAESGEAIKARQLQGSVSTTEPFDNLRLAVQVQGEKQLSLAEQFYTEEKVIRLTGQKGRIEWVKINQPERQVDGSVRYLNDITESKADFVVSEADFAGSLRQVMFDGIANMAAKLPPEISIRLFLIAMEFSDLPNKDDIADAIRKVIGERDPDKEMTPEEAAQAEQQAQQQAEIVQMQREQAILALDEQRAKVAKLNAEAESLIAQNQGGQGNPEMDAAIRQIQESAAQQIDALTRQLTKAQIDLQNKLAEINKKADTDLEVARIDADTKIQVAELSKAADDKMAAIERRMEEIGKAVTARDKQEQPDIAGMVSKAIEPLRAAMESEKSNKAQTPEAAPQPINVTVPLNLQIDAKSGSVKKEIVFREDKEGNLVGAAVIPEKDDKA